MRKSRTGPHDSPVQTFGQYTLTKRRNPVKLHNWKEGASPERRKLIRSKLHVLLATIGTLASVVGVCVAINGALEFNRTKVFIGVGITVVSTIVYIAMLFAPSE
jgi:DNA-directed RNA polymerase subunit E'/Rpb7